MDLLKAQFERIQKQLAGLTASQRMLTASLLAIMVITLVWWGKYAGEAEMEPLLDQAFSQEDVGRIKADLTAKGIHYTITGDRVMVPAEKKMEVLASLSYSHLLPRDTKVGFDEMVSKITPFGSESTNDRMFNRAKELMLSQIIQNFPNVEQAGVMIDPTRERHVEGSVEPSATVTITMQGGVTAPQQLVDAAADVVEGAQSGLSRSKIKVVVGGATRRVRAGSEADDGLGDGNEQLELVQKNEVRLSDKVRDYLSYIPDLKVSVTVKLNTKSQSESTKTYDPKNALQKESKTTSENEETSTPSSASSSEAGVGPNVGLSLVPNGAAPPAAASNTHERSSSDFQNFVPETNTVTKTPPGDVTVIAATVRVPTSFFASIYIRQNSSGAATSAYPTDAQLTPLIDTELKKIRNDVLKCTGLQSDKDVAVETYPDAMPMVASAAAPTSAASMSLLLTGHSKELVLGGLAVMSLFMVSMMVRKGMPAVVAPIIAAAGPSAVTTLDSGEIIAGEAGTSGATLDGMELDEDAVRAQQMIEQVSTMVQENPDAAASLVKRWLNRA